MKTAFHKFDSYMPPFQSVVRHSLSSIRNKRYFGARCLRALSVAGIIQRG